MAQNLTTDCIIEEVEDWVRNPNWLALPTLTAGVDEAIQGLYAVFDVSTNYVASCSGDYTVDWGDGNIENFSSSVVAEHIFNYADLGAGTEFDINGTTARQAIVKIAPQGGSSLTSAILTGTIPRAQVRVING